MMKKWCFCVAALFTAMSANAYEVRKVCAKYQTNYSWSSAYQVKTEIYNGQELNEATGNRYFGNYDMFSHYAVIWWDNGRASIIKLQFHVAGGMLLNAMGTDQNGRQWQLSDNSFGFCY